MKGIYGGSVLHLASSHNAYGGIVLWASTQQNGTFRSLDSGSTWASVVFPEVPGGNPRLGVGFSALASRDSLVYLAGYSGLLVSRDFGSTWSIPDTLPLHTFDPPASLLTVNSLLYVAIVIGYLDAPPSAVLSLSTDGGASWKTVRRVPWSTVLLQTACDIAATGVDRISIGRLTKDVKAVDYSMRVLERL